MENEDTAVFRNLASTRVQYDLFERAMERKLFGQIGQTSEVSVECEQVSNIVPVLCFDGDCKHVKYMAILRYQLAFWATKTAVTSVFDFHAARQRQ